MPQPKVKQVIVIRRDLKMRRGKEIAQGSHASMAFLTQGLMYWGGSITEGNGVQPYVAHLSEAQAIWCDEKFTKVCCRVDSEEEMRNLHAEALAAGLVSHIIVDSGLTEFGGVPTLTAMAIGPDWDYNLDPITGSLQLY